MAMASCDDISENERYTPMEFDAKKNVLVEDFTGQRCPNCPLMSEAIAAAQANLGEDRVIAVALHGGPLSVSAKQSPLGLATDVSQYYNDLAGLVSTSPYPQAQINRSGEMVSYTNLAAKIADKLSEEPQVEMVLTNEYSAADSTVKVYVAMTGLTDHVSGKLQLWIVENGIVQLQTQPDGLVDRNYVHNHVLRDTIAGNGLDGESIELEGLDTKIVEHQFKLNKAWKAENVSVVAFVYNDSGVLQATVQAILPKEE